MDKLKPILAQKFWILFSVVLIMPPVGYFMTKGDLAAQINDRTTKLNTAFTGIPAGTGVPNDSWIKALNDTNEKQKLHNRRANQELWIKQQERMFWPKDIAPIMAKAEYFKDLTEQQKGDQVIFKYPLSYRSQLRDLWEIVDPLDDGINFRDSDKRRKVAFAMADLHFSSNILLENFQPKFSEIWATQEDIWLQTELLNAIKRLNANSISQGDAFVKQMSKIQLFGGTKAAGDAGAAPGAPGSSPTGGDVSMFMMGVPGQRPEAGALSAEINLAEEFVVSLDGGTTLPGLGGFGGSSPAETMSPSSGPGGAAGAKPEVKRYLDLDEKQPYKRRGFYIKLTMDHRKVPDLIAELMNSPFPVEIVRVQQVWLSDSASSNTGGGSGMTSPSGIGFTPFNPATGSESLTASTTGSSFSEESGTSGSGTTGRPGANNPGSAAALADPNLAQVAIVGVWTLYLPPPPATDAGQTPATNSPAPTPGVAATPDSATPPAAETVAAEAKPATTESPEEAGDEPKQPNATDAPKSKPTKPEKSESDSDNSEAEKSPLKPEPATKSDTEEK